MRSNGLFLRPRVALGAVICVGLLFSIIGALPAVALIAWYLGLSLPLQRVPTLVAAVMAGAVAMSGVGLVIGYALTPKAAIATANLVFLPLAFVGGLFIPPDQLPGWADALGWFTPMRPWVEASVSAALGTNPAPQAWGLLVSWAAALSTLAVWSYRRDQTRRFA